MQNLVHIFKGII